jgi:hypothetical protein
MSLTANIASRSPVLISKFSKPKNFAMATVGVPRHHSVEVI